MIDFLSDCKKQLCISKPIKSIYDSTGALITSLGEINANEKFIYVSICRDFQTLNFLRFDQWRRGVCFARLVDLRDKVDLEIRARKYKKTRYLAERQSSFNGERTREKFVYYSDDEESSKLRLQRRKQNTSTMELFLHLQDTVYGQKISKIRDSKKKVILSNLETLINKYNKMRLSETSFIRKKQKYKGHCHSPLMIELIKQLQIVKSESYHQFDLNLFTGTALTAVEKKNMKAVENVYSKVDRFSDHYYPDLIKYNLPKILRKYPSMQRRDIYELFVNFKVLIKMTIALNQSISRISSGIDMRAFYMGLNQMNTVEFDTAKLMFENIVQNLPDRMNLNEYFEGMITLRSKNIADKIDLFINVRV